MNMRIAVPGHVPQSLVFNFDIHGDSRVTDDVHRSYEKVLRDAPDIFFTLDNGGHWIVSSFDIITDIVMNPEIFSTRHGQIPKIQNPPQFIPLSMDPPRNIPFRQALMPHFSPKAVQAMETKIRFWAGKIIDDVIAKGECDFIEDISSLFPVSIFMELMGMPLEKLREFRSLADAIFSIQDEAEYLKVAAQVVGILTEIIEEKRKNPTDDLISHMLEAQIDGRPITLEELQNMCFLLFLGGMDTVTNVTGFSYHHLAQTPELQQRLANDASLIPKFVDEALRCFGVVNTPRVVTKDYEKFGVTFKQGDMVVCLLPMAGRDERKNPNPNEFDIDRKSKEILLFSRGTHLCVGHFLARSEIRILTEEWVKRIPRFELKPGTKAGYRLGLVMAQTSLPIQWQA
jgi:cytochrome P450